jgi:DNA-directed RNA polymerase specialized sigma24 family protein
MWPLRRGGKRAVPARARRVEHATDREVLAALTALPASAQTLVRLADVAGLRYSQIAGLTGLPPRAVPILLYQARRRLLRSLSR